MFNAVQALPAGPGESDEDVFPVRLRLRLRDNFGFVLQQLRARDEAFRALAKGPWSVFIAIAAHFQMNAEAWPGQGRLRPSAAVPHALCATTSPNLSAAASSRFGVSAAAMVGTGSSTARAL